MILTINPGSSSVKFAVFKPNHNSVISLYRGSVEVIGSDSKFTVHEGDKLEQDVLRIISYEQLQINTVVDAYDLILRWLSDNGLLAEINIVCYRVVHGGDFFKEPIDINSSVLKQLESLCPLAPLHQTIAIQAINLFMQRLPELRHIACFDTAFHNTMPRVAKTFALPEHLHNQGVKPYGFHGLSYQYIAEKITALYNGIIPSRVVVAHLGGGASMCALLNGKSIATSMSFSPLDGLPMATRCGALDPSAVLYMLEQLNFSTNEVTNTLNNESGLLGLSGISGDVRALIVSDSEAAKFSLDYYIYKIRQELGVMIATLEGLDVLIFTGGVGSNSAFIRGKVCDRFKWLGMELDIQANRNNKSLISCASSKVAVYSIKTDEELMMARCASSEPFGLEAE